VERSVSGRATTRLGRERLAETGRGAHRAAGARPRPPFGGIGDISDLLKQAARRADARGDGGAARERQRPRARLIGDYFTSLQRVMAPMLAEFADRLGVYMRA
jgi:hypothetical protein